MTWLWRIATSRLGLLTLLCAGLLAWHQIDKGSAVREAVVWYVADVELTAAEAEARLLRAQIGRLKEASEALEDAILRAEQEAQDAETARLEYLAQNPSPPADCAVGPDLLDLLRR